VFKIHESIELGPLSLLPKGCMGISTTPLQPPPNNVGDIMGWGPRGKVEYLAITTYVYFWQSFCKFLIHDTQKLAQKLNARRTI
jgi:hypothetical protein